MCALIRMIFIATMLDEIGISGTAFLTNKVEVDKIIKQLKKVY